MEIERTIYSNEFMVGRGSVTHEFYKGDDGVWMMRKPNARDGKEREFKPERRTTWVNKYERIANPQPTLFSVPKEPRVTIKEVLAQVQELRSMVVPAAPNDDLLHDDITSETIVKPIMYNEEVLGPRPNFRVLQRHHVGGDRYYVVQFENGGRWSAPDFYVGVTSISDHVLVPDEARAKWQCSFPTYEDYMDELNLLASKGTVMHSLIAMCVMCQLPDFGTSEFDRVLRGLISREGLDPDKHIGEWRIFMTKALMGFKQFVHDRNVEFLAVEVVLGIPHEYPNDGSGTKVHGFFGQIDLLCMMDGNRVRKQRESGEFYVKGEKKGQPKMEDYWETTRVLADIDFKSGENDYESHDFQLGLHRLLIERAFPHLDTGKMEFYNFHPVMYRESSVAKADAKEGKEVEFSYTLLKKDIRRDWIDDHLRIWRKYHAKEMPKKIVYFGSPNVDIHPSKNYAVMDYAGYWEAKIDKASKFGHV